VVEIFFFVIISTSDPLQINLPAAHKFDPPSFQNASSSSMPSVDVAPGVTAKVLVGSINGSSSPIVTAHIPMEYIDFESAPDASFSYQARALNPEP
jgi:redox-sensitive bicupin YhaK (pirin superfamily)